MASHPFHPTRYYSTLGTVEPVLHLAPGDTLLTTTIDAGGYDSKRERVATGSNPQTGPFYIEGAEPGDTLVVHFDKLAPKLELTHFGGSSDILVQGLTCQQDALTQQVERPPTEHTSLNQLDLRYRSFEPAVTPG